MPRYVWARDLKYTGDHCLCACQERLHVAVLVISVSVVIDGGTHLRKFVGMGQFAALMETGTDGYFVLVLFLWLACAAVFL